MSKFAYFNPQDGRVLQWIDTEAMAYVLPNASMLHGCSDAEWELQHQGEMMVKNGAVVPYVAPPPDASAVKAAKLEAIKAKRDAIKAGGVKVGVKWYHSDTESRIQHLGLKDQARDLLAAGQPDTTRLQKLGQDVRWKTMDGSFIYLTVKHAFDIVAAVGDLDALAFTAAETHRVAMEASADPASYDFSGGWPATFPG